jgi:hypothetical protein
MQSAATPIVVDTTATTLDDLLKLELAAAATYEAALEHVSGSDERVALELNRTSHVTRASTLGKMVRSSGAQPSQSAGPWLALSKLAERGAALFGDEAITKVLIEGEKAVMNRIDSLTGALASSAHRIVQQNIVADEVRCIDRLEAVVAAHEAN